jgi:hypothetical protein
VTGTPAYRVVWNEGVDYMGERSNRPSVRAIPLTDGPVIAGGLKFTVPDVPIGVYPVVIYDGDEGGDHYPWDYFQVTRPAQSPLTRSRVALGLLILAVSVAAAAAWHQRAH